MCTEALVAHAAEHLAADTDVSLCTFFDHEEVGSASACGAGSPIMGEAVRRISTALNAGAGNEDLYAAALRRSLVFSVDMAHAVHPNYASKHESMHGPQMNQGLVIKTNANQRYATTGLTSYMAREIARRGALPPPQEFVVRNDCPCGSTIGPIIAAATGMRAVDVGMPQLSMHSVRGRRMMMMMGPTLTPTLTPTPTPTLTLTLTLTLTPTLTTDPNSNQVREMMGVKDLAHGLDMFKGFLKDFRAIDEEIGA